MWKRQDAFSLLEILITISLIALFTAVLLPNVTDIFRVNLDSFARTEAGLFREARDHAILTSRVVRLRFDLDKQTYWVEDAPGSFLLPETTNERSAGIFDKKKKEKGRFNLVKLINKKKKVVPDGLRIAAILSPRSPEIIEEGFADVYYFPHGIGEAVVLHMEDQDGEQRSLILNPITGKTRIEVGFYFPGSRKGNRRR